jgi:antitoxin (DNA-binding transcriptional repressor) of toxin-antitoxin stability system
MGWNKRVAGPFQGVLTSLLVALSCVSAAAQSTVNPTKAQFTASPDQNATLPDGTPVVQFYQLELYLVGATAPFQTLNMGKPTPDSSGTITVDLTAVFTGWPIPGTLYDADVAAVGPGGVGRSALSNTFSFTAQCSPTVAPLTATEPAAGGTATASVTAASGCGWTAISNVSWTTVTAGASGTGNGTVTYSVAANTSTTARAGTLTVAGQTVTVTQSGTCSFIVAPLTAIEPAAGGTATASVTAASGCGWTAISNVSWITVTAGASGTGNGTVSYSVAANTSTTARVGTLTVAGQTVTVTQSGTCSFNVAPLTATEPEAGGTATASVTAASGCSWTARSNVTWIAVTAGLSGTGNGTVSYAVIAETSPGTRTGTLTVAGQTVTVTQVDVLTPPTNLRIVGP